MGNGIRRAARGKGDHLPGRVGFAAEEGKQVAGSGESTSRKAVSGHLDGVDGDSRLLFRPDGGNESVPVVIGVVMSDEELVRAAWTGRRALAVRTDGPGPLLVLVAFLRERVTAKARDAWPAEVEVRMDGETVHIKARRKIELVCGKSKIVLDADGRVEVNGSHLLSRSRGPVKIKGATVEIN